MEDEKAKIDELLFRGSETARAEDAIKWIRALYDVDGSNKISRRLYGSYVDSLFQCYPPVIVQVEFSRIFASAAAKLQQGEYLLKQVLGDEWLNIEKKTDCISYIVLSSMPHQRVILFESGTEAEFVYIVVKGALGVSDHSNATVWRYMEGDIIGRLDVALKRSHVLNVWGEPTLSVCSDARPLLLRIPAELCRADNAIAAFIAGVGAELINIRNSIKMQIQLALVPNNDSEFESVMEVLKDVAIVDVDAGDVLERDQIAFVFVVRGKLQIRGCVGHFTQGWIAVGLNRMSGDDVIAEQQCRVCCIPRQCIPKLMSNDAFQRILWKSISEWELKLPYIMLNVCRGQHLPQVCKKGSLVVLHGRLKLVSGGESSWIGRKNAVSVVPKDDAVAASDASLLSFPESDGNDIDDGLSKLATVSTVSIYTAENLVDLALFVKQLASTFTHWANTKLISGYDMWASHGCTFSDAARLFPNNLYRWLQRQRRVHKYVILHAEVDSTREWKIECAAAADAILYVAHAHSTPRDVFFKVNSSVENHFVLVHDVCRKRFLGSQLWRPLGLDLTGFHHVRRGRNADLRRLYRRLVGKGIALVMGGHAEGVSAFAYLGSLQAFQEAKIPIDIIGGSYTGAAVAAMHALSVSPLRMNRRLRRMHNVFTIQDPLLDMILSFLDSSYTFGERFRRSIETTFSFCEKTRPYNRQRYSVDDMDVAAFFATATHKEYGLPVELYKGDAADVICASMRIPTLMPGSLCAGSFSLPLPCQQARQKGADVVFSVRVDVPFTGDARGGWWWSWAMGTGHAALSHLAVASSNACGRLEEECKSDYSITPTMWDVQAHEYHRAKEVAQRSYEETLKVIAVMKQDSELLKQIEHDLSDDALEASQGGEKEDGERFSWIKDSEPVLWKKLVKLGLLGTAFAIAWYFIRRKALEVEKARLEEFIKAEENVQTNYID